MQIYLGSFHTAEEASAAYQKAALQNFGPFCRSEAEKAVTAIGRVARRALHSRNTSGHENISLRAGAYQVNIYRDKEPHYLGRYRTKKEARQVRAAFLRGEHVELPKMRLNNSTGENISRDTRKASSRWRLGSTVRGIAVPESAQ